MRRTTILLDDDLADQLDYERRRRNKSTTAIVREALAEYLTGGQPRPRRPGFIALGRSRQGGSTENVDEILRREWLPALLKDSFNPPSPAEPGKQRPAKTRRDR